MKLLTQLRLLLQPYLICRKRLRIYFPTTKYPYGFSSHLFHLFLTISFEMFYHGSQYVATTILSLSIVIALPASQRFGSFHFSFGKMWGCLTLLISWIINSKKPGTLIASNLKIMSQLIFSFRSTFSINFGRSYPGNSKQTSKK